MSISQTLLIQYILQGCTGTILTLSSPESTYTGKFKDFGRIQRVQGFNESQAVNGNGSSLHGLAADFTHASLRTQDNDHQAPLRPQPDLPSAYALASYSALFRGFLFPSSASLSGGLYFPGDSSLLPPCADVAPAVSVLAAPVPSQLSHF